MSLGDSGDAQECPHNPAVVYRGYMILLQTDAPQTWTIDDQGEPLELVDTGAAYDRICYVAHPVVPDLPILDVTEWPRTLAGLKTIIDNILE